MLVLQQLINKKMTTSTNPNCSPGQGQTSSFNCYQLLTPLPTQSGTLTNIDTTNPIPYIVTIAEVLVSLGIVVAVFFIVWGGIIRMTSPGNVDKQREGTKIIQRTIVGLLLLAFSYILITTINPSLVNNPFTQVNSTNSQISPQSSESSTNNSNVLDQLNNTSLPTNV